MIQTLNMVYVMDNKMVMIKEERKMDGFEAEKAELEVEVERPSTLVIFSKILLNMPNKVCSPVNIVMRRKRRSPSSGLMIP